MALRFEMALLAGFEPTTYWFEASRSRPLSYRSHFSNEIGEACGYCARRIGVATRVVHLLHQASDKKWSPQRVLPPCFQIESLRSWLLDDAVIETRDTKTQDS
jgi:hypothetical protein